MSSRTVWVDFERVDGWGQVTTTADRLQIGDSVVATGDCGTMCDARVMRHLEGETLLALDLTRLTMGNEL